MIGLTDAQRAIYNAVTAKARTWDERLLALHEQSRADDVNTQDLIVVRRWLIAELDRERAR